MSREFEQVRPQQRETRTPLLWRFGVGESLRVGAQRGGGSGATGAAPRFTRVGEMRSLPVVRGGGGPRPALLRPGVAELEFDGRRPSELKAVPHLKSIHSIRLDGFLSFAPGSPALELEPLNVLIGPNASGKSNLIEAFELLRSTPTDLAAAIRDGGGPREWIWKGQPRVGSATIETVLAKENPAWDPLRHRLEFSTVQNRVKVLDEAIEELEPRSGETEPFFYYRFQRGDPVINIRQSEGDERRAERRLRLEDFQSSQSVLAQRKDPDLYPEVTWVGNHFREMQLFRERTLGRAVTLRTPQPADLPGNLLLPDASNLALVLNGIEHWDGPHFNAVLRRFFPRFQRMTTGVVGGAVQFYLHESGIESAIPAARLSDGTIRFIAILAILLAPDPPSFVCIEEPELGLHPDAAAQVAELLVEASSRMQLVVTTHSESLVSALTDCPDAVITCERPGPATTLHRLDPDGLKHWLDEYRLGDLWKMGELGAYP